MLSGTRFIVIFSDQPAPSLKDCPHPASGLPGVDSLRLGAPEPPGHCQPSLAARRRKRSWEKISRWEGKALQKFSQFVRNVIQRPKPQSCGWNGNMLPHVFLGQNFLSLRPRFVVNKYRDLLVFTKEILSHMLIAIMQLGPRRSVLSIDWQGRNPKLLWLEFLWPFTSILSTPPTGLPERPNNQLDALESIKFQNSLMLRYIKNIEM